MNWSQFMKNPMSMKILVFTKFGKIGKAVSGTILMIENRCLMVLFVSSCNGSVRQSEELTDFLDVKSHVSRFIIPVSNRICFIDL